MIGSGVRRWGRAGRLPPERNNGQPGSATKWNSAIELTELLIARVCSTNETSSLFAIDKIVDARVPYVGVTINAGDNTRSHARPKPVSGKALSGAVAVSDKKS